MQTPTTNNINLFPLFSSTCISSHGELIQLYGFKYNKYASEHQSILMYSIAL